MNDGRGIDEGEKRDQTLRAAASLWSALEHSASYEGHQGLGQQNLTTAVHELCAATGILDASKDGGGLKRKNPSGRIFHEGPEADTENSSHVQAQGHEVRKRVRGNLAARGTSSHTSDLEPATAQTSEWSHSNSRRTCQDSGSGATCSPTKIDPGIPADADPPPNPYRYRPSRAQYKQPAAHSGHAASLDSTPEIRAKTKPPCSTRA